MSEMLYQKLSEIAEITMGQSPSSSDCNDKGEGLPFYQGNADFGFKSPTPSRYCTKPKKVAGVGDILMSVRAPVGDVNIANEECAIGRGLSAIKSVKVVQQYLYFFLQSYKSEWGKIQQGSTFEAINKNDLIGLNVFTPPLQEQQKIATILSTVDEAIEKTENIIGYTEKVKKGLLQKLLIKGTGHSRFKNTEIGEIPEGWNVQRFGDLVQIQVGYAFKSADFVQKGIRLLRGANISPGAIKWEDTKYFPEIKAEDYSSYYLQEKDIVIGMDRPFVGKGFKVARITKQDLPALLLQRVAKVKFSSKLDADYAYMVLNSDLYQTQLVKLSTGMDLPHISASNIAFPSIPVPPIAEQKEIASILSSFNQKLNYEKRKFSQLLQLRTGLMQNLFTGTVRIKVGETEVTQV